MPRLLIRVRAQIDPVHLADESGSEKDLDQNGEQAVAQGVGRDDHHSAQANPCATEQKTNGEAFAPESVPGLVPIATTLARPS